MSGLLTERMFRRALIAIALGGLVFGAVAWANGLSDVANWCWAAGTLPVVIGLLISMIRDFLGGSHGGGLGRLRINVGCAGARSEFGRYRRRHHVRGR